MDFVRSSKSSRSSKSNSMPTYLIESDDDPSKCPRTIGLMHGNFQLLPELPLSLSEAFNLAHSKQDIHLVHFVNSSEEDELAEFRILNYKDRVIVRAIEDDKVVIFGSRATLTSNEFYGIDVGGTLVVRGPVSLRHLHKQEDEDLQEDKSDEEGLLEGDTFESKVPLVKYSGHVTLNISGFAYIDIADSGLGVNIIVPSESKFSVERTIPHRFQQKTIVQRQKEKFQSTQGMMALETFTHLN